MGKADVLTVAQAAERLSIGTSLAYKLARNGEIPCLRLGRRLVVPRAALEAFLLRAGKDDPTREPSEQRPLAEVR